MAVFHEHTIRVYLSCIPHEGIWQRFIQTLESTVCRNGDAREMFFAPHIASALQQDALTDLPRLQVALEFLYHTGGQIQIQELAAHCGLSLRQFERWFKRQIGISPKVFARLLRFEAFRDSLLHESVAHMGEAASDFGYQDQAHVIRECKFWSGYTPGAFLALVNQRRKAAPFLPDPRRSDCSSRKRGEICHQENK